MQESWPVVTKKVEFEKNTTFKDSFWNIRTNKFLTQGRECTIFQQNGFVQEGFFWLVCRLKESSLYLQRKISLTKGFFRKDLYFWEFSDYQIFDAKNQKALNQQSPRSKKTSIKTSMIENRPLFTEDFEFEYRVESKILKLIGIFRVSRIWCRNRIESFLHRIFL